MTVAVESPEPNQTTVPCAVGSWRRRWRAWCCLATFLVSPFGWLVRGRFIRRLEPERLDRGLVLILTGVEGRSFLNLAMLQGLLDAGVPYALDIVDWTTGFKPFLLYHLRGAGRNRRVAARLAERIRDYQSTYPGRPVWIIGHSGGGGMALLTANSLPAPHRLTGLILLAPAVSPRYDFTAALTKVERGIWSYSSWIDCVLVGLGTTLFGTIDGRHGPAAGMVGFRWPDDPESPVTLHQTRYRKAFSRQYHWGGHFGWTHRVFIAETIAPLLAVAREQGDVPRSQ